MPSETNYRWIGQPRASLSLSCLVRDGAARPTRRAVPLEAWHVSGAVNQSDPWENPRNIAILVGAVAALAATVGGLAGYKIGSTLSPSITINVPAQK